MKLTINEAGEDFLHELRRHHLDCYSERDVTPCAPGEGPLDRSADSAGSAFVEALLRRFHGEGVA